MKKCIICIPAFRARDWIIDSVASCKEQVMPRGWDLEIRVGVDGCNQTAEVLKQHKIPFWMSINNVGTYVLRNSLILLNEGDAYYVHGADDVMSDRMIERLLIRLEPDILPSPYKTECSSDLMTFYGKPSKARGCFLFPHNVLKALGGFRQERVSMDGDFYRRAAVISAARRVWVKDSHFLRRIHPESLTHNKFTGHKSEYRKRIKRQAKQDLLEGKIRIRPTITNLDFHGE